MRRYWHICVVFFAVILITMFYFFRPKADINSETKKVSASNESSIISTSDDWNAGTLSNTSVSYESICIDDKTLVSPAEISQSGATLTTDYADATKQYANDRNLDTAWGPVPTNGADHYWQIDFGSSKFVKRFVIDAYIYNGANMYSSTNGIDWVKQTEIILTNTIRYTFSTTLTSAVNARYWKIVSSGGTPYPDNANIYEVYFYDPGSATATHTSAATQITHSDLYEWQTFTPTYTAPANTTVSFRLRTSTDASNWTSWTAYQTPTSGSSLDITSLVTSSTGSPGEETFYKYIQVETKLTSSDGTSTPTVSDYTINYHTNVAPSTPTAMTAVVGE